MIWGAYEAIMWANVGKCGNHSQRRWRGEVVENGRWLWGDFRRVSYRCTWKKGQGNKIVKRLKLGSRQIWYIGDEALLLESPWVIESLYHESWIDLIVERLIYRTQCVEYRTIRFVQVIPVFIALDFIKLPFKGLVFFWSLLFLVSWKVMNHSQVSLLFLQNTRASSFGPINSTCDLTHKNCLTRK